jgi:tetratricopeptide (TPR) repeat protein
MAFVYTNQYEYKIVEFVNSVNDLIIPDAQEFTYYNLSVWNRTIGKLFESIAYSIKSFMIGCEDKKRIFNISRERSISYDDLLTAEYSTDEIVNYNNWFNFHYELGDYYYLFVGNKILAEENYLKAIEIHNHPIAMHDLAYNIYYLSGKYEAAKDLFIKSANRGYVFAMLHLGDYYLQQEKEYPKALEWYLKAFKKNEKLAAPYLGNYYSNIEKNYDEAIRYYLIDKQYNARFVNINIGNTYWKKGDLESAVFYFLEAASAGFTNGMTRLGNYYQEVVKDYNTAKQWYIKAIENNNIDAMECMAKFYETIEINPEETNKYRKMITDTINRIFSDTAKILSIDV